MRLLPRVLGTLRARCQLDGKYSVGVVRSICYDTHRLQSVGEKLNNDFLKTKVSLRRYGTADTGQSVGHCFLETKFKIGSCRRKLRIQTDLTAKTVSGYNLSAFLSR